MVRAAAAQRLKAENPSNPKTIAALCPEFRIFSDALRFHAHGRAARRIRKGSEI
jgi:hypothetical protein